MRMCNISKWQQHLPCLPWVSWVNRWLLLWLRRSVI